MSTKFYLITLAASVALLAAGGCGSSSSYNSTGPSSPGGGTVGGGSGGAGGSGMQVVISSMAYGALTVPTGSTVTWMNNDPMTHTATADSSSAFQFDTGDVSAGATSTGVTFTQAGTFAYHCKYHSNMHGSITVQDSMSTY